MGKIVGITTDFDDSEVNRPMYRLRKACVDAFAGRGVNVVLIPQVYGDMDCYVKMVDALVVAGGKADIPPDVYGEDVMFENVHINRHRSDFDLEMVRRFVPTNKPILGICAGMQTINVALGGSLYQDIKGQLPGKLEHCSINACHGIDVVGGTLLHKILGCSFLKTNSFHHQCVRRVAEGLVVGAVSEDGIIESIEKPGHKFCLGVQWHPERSDGFFNTKITDAFCAQVVAG